MNKTSAAATRLFGRTSTDAVPLSRIIAILGAGLLGLFIVLGAGFAPMPAVHSAIHDVRHSAAFPCH